jgi:hypothetical protein
MLHDWFLVTTPRRVDKATNHSGLNNTRGGEAAPETVAI